MTSSIIFVSQSANNNYWMDLCRRNRLIGGFMKFTFCANFLNSYRRKRGWCRRNIFILVFTRWCNHRLHISLFMFLANTAMSTSSIERMYKRSSCSGVRPALYRLNITRLTCNLAAISWSLSTWELQIAARCLCKYWAWGYAIRGMGFPFEFISWLTIILYHKYYYI